MLKNYFRSKYYKRILVFILLAGMVPVMILSALALKLTGIYTDNFYDMHQSIIVNQKNRVEDTLKSTEYAMIQFLSSSDVAKIMRTPREARNFQAFTAIMQKLFQMQSPRLEIEDTILVSFEQNWVLSNNTFTDLDTSSFRKIISDFKSSPRNSFWYSNDDKGFIYLVKKLPLNALNSNGMMILQIGNSAIERITLDENDNFPVTVINEERDGIIGTEKNLEIAKYVGALPEYAQTIQQGGMIQLSYKGEDYTLTSSKSEYNNWIYVSIVLSSKLNEGINNLYFIIILLILLIITGMIIFAVYFSKKLYQPIDSMNQAMDNEIMASKKEVSALSFGENPSEKLSFILSSIGEMRKNLSMQKKNEMKHFLQQVYTGNLPEPEEEDFKKKGITDTSLDGCFMFTVGMKYVDGFEDKKDSELYMFALQNIIEEIFPASEFLMPICINEILYTTYYRRALSKVGIEIYIRNLCESLIRISEQYLHLKIYVGISSCFTSIREFQQAADQCNMALRICVQRSNFIEFYTEEKNNHFLYSDTKLNIRRMKLIRSVTEGNSEAGRTELDEYFMELRQINYYLFKLEINRLLSDILTCMNASSLLVDYSLIGRITNFDITSSLNSIEDLKKCLWENFLVPLYRKAIEPPETETANTLNEIIDYLDKNIENNISLEQCAKQFNYNPNYLSRMFKSHFGKTFTDYVIDQKVNMSKQLLLTTELSVNEIAARLGYNNSQNFIRVFKKIVLMTPGQYRNKKEQHLLDTLSTSNPSDTPSNHS